MQTTDPDVELTQIRRLTATGRYRRADRRCRAALSRFPDHPRLLATQASLDAYLGRTSFAESERVLRAIADHHPSDVRFAAMPTAMVLKQGRYDEAVAEARELTRRFPGDPWAEIVLAGYIYPKAATQQETWFLFKHSLPALSGATPCHRSAAYGLARQYEPPSAPAVLQWADPFERAVIRTRALGYSALALVFLVAMTGALVLRADHLVWAGLVVAGLAASLGVWMVVANQAVCCVRCRNVWLVDLALLALLFALAPADPWWYWLGRGGPGSGNPTAWAPGPGGSV